MCVCVCVFIHSDVVYIGRYDVQPAMSAVYTEAQPAVADYSGGSTRLRVGGSSTGIVLSLLTTWSAMLSRSYIHLHLPTLR